MTQEQFDLFLSFAAGLCGVAAVLPLLRIKSRGAAAILMSLAFLALGGIVWLQKVGAPRSYTIVGCVTLAILLVAEFVVRADRQARKAKRP